MGVDGARLDATRDPAPDDPVVRAAARIGARGAMLHWVALGGLAPEDAALVRRALEHVRGSYRRVAPSAYASPFFDAIALPRAQEVWVETGDGREIRAALDTHGAFSAHVPLSPGANALVIHARTSDGELVGRRVALAFDDARAPGAQHKELEIRPEPGP
jgi:hypothetical protein